MSSKKRREVSRRTFLRAAGLGTLGLGMTRCMPHVHKEWETCRMPALPSPLALSRSPRVIEVISSKAVNPDNYRLDEAVAARMVRAGLLALTGAASEADAWKVIIPERQPGEAISFKVNTLSQYAPSSPEVLTGLTTSLLEPTGIDSGEVFVWDRTQSELESRGLTADRLKVPCRATFASFKDKTGPGYEDQTVCLSGKKIHLSRLLTRDTKHLVNVAILKNHTVSGVTGCLKNHYGSFCRPGDFHQGSEQHIALLNTFPQIVDVSRLYVIDALLAVVLGDTDGRPDCAPGRLLFSFDPVAIDQRALEIRDEYREKRGAKPGLPAGYLEVAESFGLGTRQYDLVTIEEP